MMMPPEQPQLFEVIRTYFHPNTIPPFSSTIIRVENDETAAIAAVRRLNSAFYRNDMDMLCTYRKRGENTYKFVK